MANVNAPSGLSPTEYLNGSPFNGQARQYFIPSTDTNAYAIGDPVITLTGAADAGGVQAVTLAAATGPILGVIVGTSATKYGGPSVDPANMGNTTIIPATKTKGYYVMVVDDPNVIFEVMAFGSSLVAASVGKNANLKVGANNGFISGWTLDDSTIATTSTLQVRIVGLVQRIDNAPGAQARALVLINVHQYAKNTAGI